MTNIIVMKTVYVVYIFNAIFFVNVITDACHTLDLKLGQKAWVSSHSKMRFPRRYFGLVSVQDNLFAIGGEVNTAAACQDSVDVFNEATGAWDKVASLPTALKGLADL